MKSSLKNPTKAEVRRIQIIKGEIGCVACRIDGHGYVPADAHHLLSGGRRISHSHTIPLCPWHHRGVVADYKPIGMPSLALDKKKFEEWYGTEEQLLEFTNVAGEAFERTVV